MGSLRFYNTANIGMAGWQALQRQFMEKYPTFQIETEKHFLTEPTITSYLVSFPAANPDTPFLDQLREQQLLAWYEQASEPASLLWLHTLLPREDTSQQEALQGLVQVLRDRGKYELRVLNTETRITGINAVTGATFYSPEVDETMIATLPFSLGLDERLILWCRRQGGEQEAVATALLSRDRAGVLTIEASDGINIQKIQPRRSRDRQTMVD